MTSTLKSGHPSPLGASVDQLGVNFALFAENAERVELCLFGSDGKRKEERVDLPQKTKGVWHGFLPGAKPGLHYGYRVYGPYQPENGHRFNHHKLLIDPYARAFDGELQINDVHYGYVRESAEADLSFDNRDSAAFMPKCIVVPKHVSTIEKTRPEWPWSDAIIYEAHVKGLTQTRNSLPAGTRGRFSALGQPDLVNYLTELGINTLELLPVHYFADDDFLVSHKLRNYWGYQSLGFFSAANRYAQGDNANKELAEAVSSLHNSDIKVVLDVVYNHTGESNELGPTLCYRGIDNLAYYHLEDNRRYYVNHSGTGNTLRSDHPRVLQLIMDSLRYWHDEIGVDGFRFDLASILGRESHGFDSTGGFFQAIAQDPVLQSAHMIAEPWDLGPDGYQLGNYPQHWSEWNDRYRDTVRRFWLTDDSVRADFARRLLGSSDLFEHGSRISSMYESPPRLPSASINFISAHDGYCLEDVVSYVHKHNEKNGENNQDGHNGEVSNNHGHEGPSTNNEINALRTQQQRNLLTTLLISQGIPMLLAGDERHRTQGGNNNAYCQDNEINWLNWSEDNATREMTFFFRKLVSLRQRFPVLRRSWYLHAQHITPSGHADVTWFNKHGNSMTDNDWHDTNDRFLGVQLAGDAGPQSNGYPEVATCQNLLLLFNAGGNSEIFSLDSSVLISKHWQLELDTHQPYTPLPASQHTDRLQCAFCAAQSLVILSSTSD